MNPFRAIRRNTFAVGLLASALTLLLFPGSSVARNGGNDRDDPFNRRGNILITDQFNNRVIEINPAGEIVWPAPYSAYVIGDYTGITPPFDNDVNNDHED